MINQSEKSKHNILSKMAVSSNLPKDVLLGAPIITLTGQIELSLENYRGIIEYTDTLVRVQTKIGLIKVIGKNLKIEYYTSDEMKVQGLICSIEYA